MTARSPPLDIAALRARLAGARGRQVWTCFEEILDEPAFRKWLSVEFPAIAMPERGRRDVLKLFGASLVLASLAGCGAESRSDRALPYVEQPEEVVPGVPRLYASALTFEGFAQPVLATTHAGRPTKLDGNPQHPLGTGASDAFTQTAVLQLFDPGRSQGPMFEGRPTTWAAFERALAELRREWRARQGEGVRILSGDVTSPTLVRQLNDLLTALPGARLHLFEPVGAGHRSEAIRLAFGRDLEQHYRLEKCEVIVSLDDDLLGAGPRQVQHARAWSQRRGEDAERVRLHVAECTPGLTGVVATTRLAVDAGRMPELAAALAAELGIDTRAPELADKERQWIARAARELREHAGRSLLAAGAQLPPAAQALAAYINERLGNAGVTVWYSDPIAFRPAAAGSLADLARDIAVDKVETLVVLDANPAYAAPADLGLDVRRVRERIHAGLYRDETAWLARWHLPLAHALESWSDARAVEGTATIIQPLVTPFFSVRTIHQIADMLLGRIDPAADASVRATWNQTFGESFEARWRQALHDGFVADTAVAPVAVNAGSVELPAPSASEEHIDIAFRPDPTIWDGRFANVGWLQELPKPLTKITWDNAIAVSPALAEAHALGNGDVVELVADGRKVSGPAWVVPGQAPRTVAVFLGYGRRLPNLLADGIGYDAFILRSSADPWLARGTLRKSGAHVTLATSQSHHRMEGFDFVREVEARAALPQPPAGETMYRPWEYRDYAWGMAIDLDLCIGCNACIAACSAENNVPMVGKDEVAMGREMLWLRVDRYYRGGLEDPRSFFQPVPCMHCEQAPCEMGCPVHATVHSPEGVNQMVYNRCIGTRTCSSYCPYKVRRFNWFDYRAPADSPLHAAHNPDVTVRSRGVMEKCTYCTQRIESAHAAADKGNRRIGGDEVVTACQQACPTRAIVFGNINDPDSAVSKRRRSGRHYVLLEELGTRPRTTYLARIKESDGA
jgi:molybdopterin-containing oxidoreductase family iron-sulfur binding subunit